MDKSLYSLAERVGQALNGQGIVMATAESCTGGWVAKCMTDVPGSSAWFDCGFTVYNRDAKQQILGVPAAVIDVNGEVSEATVEAMAEGAIAQSRAAITVAISGIAGPSGGTREKPVGTVCFAWCLADRVAGVMHNSRTISCRELFSGDREAVRRQAVEKGLQGVLDILQDHASA
ncbi:CinA family protein [Sulfuriflexus sp.]|uniref:CinA family protein n=1 Tax=Sulfuriflexus sp. TaxID=2015443 RepID=UPI0028CBE8DD|nr:CinA family protein [Sulfuriflexus sp.]MDT8403813.1 CinA family protein [Sulfuriflexus sp.]